MDFVLNSFAVLFVGTLDDLGDSKIFCLDFDDGYDLEGYGQYARNYVGLLLLDAGNICTQMCFCSRRVLRESTTRVDRISAMRLTRTRVDRISLPSTNFSFTRFFSRICMVPSNRVLFIAVADYFCSSKQVQDEETGTHLAFDSEEKGTASHHPPIKSRPSWGAGNSAGAMSIEKIPLNAEASYGVGSLL
jgi:hypothetical protein